MSQTLRSLASAGWSVIYIGTETPYLLTFVDTKGVAVEQVPPVTSAAIRGGGAITSQDVLLMCRIADRMCAAAVRRANRYDHVVLWGTYLLPYGQAAALSAATLDGQGIHAHLWLTPTGSDVWEVGPQLQMLTEGLLGSPRVSRVVTYTDAFAQEIGRRYPRSHPVSVVKPGLDLTRFHPVAPEEKGRARAALGITDRAFVITSHSNMRPVKMPQDVVSIAERTAESLDREVVLVLVGPKQEVAPATAADNLRVISTGVVPRVEGILQASDLELNCSLHDSFNLSLAEAMACGLPCVSTDVVGIGPDIVSAEAGLLFSCTDRANGEPGEGHRAAVRYIAELASDEQRRLSIGRSAARYAVMAFREERVIDEFQSLLLDTSALRLSMSDEMAAEDASGERPGVV